MPFSPSPSLPPSLRITSVSAVSAAQAAAWYEVTSAAVRHDLPDDTPPSPEQVLGALRAAAPPDGDRRFWLAADPEGRTVGVASLLLFGSVGQRHLAELEMSVHPGHRREGVGAELLTQVVAAMRADGRRALIGRVVVNGPGAAFAVAQGFRPVLPLTHLLLDTARADTRWADSVPPGHSLVTWTGTVPDALADALAAAKNAMNDMPTGEMDFGSRQWDAERVRAMARVVADRGDTLLTVAAMAGERMAGYTEVVLRPGEKDRAQQYDTVVVPEHRGHGLGLLLKAAMVRRVRADHPTVTEIETDNADDNTHMLAVNERLGFRAYRRTCVYQLELEQEEEQQEQEEGQKEEQGVTE
ncbi:GNAT family N-acetyltransferase [Streptomyces sp. NPDC088789]|uniref:GNAT family N-acetyltransferase n=1 Tax=Streptomyces sp. NPDC088789 TaxID=3365899 RepID=UPI0038040977